MHFEILVEDASGKILLETLIPKIIGAENTFNIHKYKGIGHIPKGLSSKGNPEHRMLLDQLPRLINGFGAAFANYPSEYKACLVIVCDLDDKNLTKFRNDLNELLLKCFHAPKTLFCIAIEEGEAWLLGDLDAIKSAYPHAKDEVLNRYVPDSICGTWERLADAIYSGGSEKLKSLDWVTIGTAKCEWAERISPYMNTKVNTSPSFNSMLVQLHDLL